MLNFLTNHIYQDKINYYLVGFINSSNELTTCVLLLIVLMSLILTFGELGFTGDESSLSPFDALLSLDSSEILSIRFNKFSSPIELEEDEPLEFSSMIFCI